MSKPTEKLWELEAHSRAKHVILRMYLHAWLPVMSSLVARRASDGRAAGSCSWTASRGQAATPAASPARR
jgi:hypothetical protein